MEGNNKNCIFYHESPRHCIYNPCSLCVSLGPYCGSREHANSVLMLQDVRYFGRGGYQ